MKTKKKSFLYNSKKPELSMDIYSNNNPKDTIPIKYSTLIELQNTIINLEKLYKNKKYNHKRISQVGLILKVRLEILNKYKKTKFKKAKNVYSRYLLAKKYFNFLKYRSKLNTFSERKNIDFKF